MLVMRLGCNRKRDRCRCSRHPSRPRPARARRVVSTGTGRLHRVPSLIGSRCHRAWEGECLCQSSTSSSRRRPSSASLSPELGRRTLRSRPRAICARSRASAGIADPKARSVALFAEAGRVITHPRCVNCHPVSDRPLQGNAGQPHQPPIFATESGMGSPSAPCSSCHGQSNFTLIGTRVGSMPGNPKWQLAPREMAWQGKVARRHLPPDQGYDPERGPRLRGADRPRGP